MRAIAIALTRRGIRRKHDTVLAKFILPALLGVIAGGALIAHSRAAACSCALPARTIRVQHSNEPDPSVWPERAVITADVFSQLRFRVLDLNHSAKADSFEAGPWSKP